MSGTGSESDEYSAYLGYKNDKLHAGAKLESYKSEYEVLWNQCLVGPLQDMTMDIPKSDRTKASSFIKLFDLADFMPVISP